MVWFGGQTQVIGVPISFVQCDVSRRLSDAVNKGFVHHVGLDEACFGHAAADDDGATDADNHESVPATTTGLVGSTAVPGAESETAAPHKTRDVQLVLFSFVLFESGSWRDFLRALWRQSPRGSVFLFNDPKKFETAKVAAFLSQSVAADAGCIEDSAMRLLWAGTCLLVVKE